MDSSDPAYHAEYQGRQGVVLLDSSSPQAIWTVRVEQEGLYNIALDYYPAAAKSQNITVAVKVNGESPYDEAERIALPQIWRDELDSDQPFATDANGNDLMPDQIRAPKWVVRRLSDSEGYYDDPLLFCFGRGQHRKH